MIVGEARNVLLELGLDKVLSEQLANLFDSVVTLFLGETVEPKCWRNVGLVSVKRGEARHPTGRMTAA